MQTPDLSQLVVPADADREGMPRGMGIATLSVKVAAQQTAGGLLVIEQVNHAAGGPPRHVHPDQDEWFMALEGEYAVQVGEGSVRLGPGDSLLAPRGVPHVWACMGAGRLLVAFTPAGRMDDFFRRVAAGDAMPGLDPELWISHGMRVVGPPLEV